MIWDSNWNFKWKLQTQFQIQADINFKLQQFELYSSNPTSIMVGYQWSNDFLRNHFPFLAGVGLKNVFELYSSRPTSFVLVLFLYLAYLKLFQGWEWVVGKSDLKENPKSNLDLDLDYLKLYYIIYNPNILKNQNSWCRVVY